MNYKEIRAFKDSVRARDGLCCTQCGMTQAEHLDQRGRKLDVHRKVPGSAYTADGCVTLCSPCHSHRPEHPRNGGRKKTGRRFTRCIRFVVDPAWLDQVKAHAKHLGLNPAAYIRMAVNHEMTKEPLAEKPRSDRKSKQSS